MKIAVNAIRVSASSGGGIDHYIIPLVNALARECGQKKIELDVYTLCPEHFPDVSRQQLRAPFFLQTLRNFMRRRNQPESASVKTRANKTKSSLNILHHGMDWFKMVWTQVCFPLHLFLRGYDVVFSMTQFEALPYPPTSQVVMVLDIQPFLIPDKEHKHQFFLYHFLEKAMRNSRRVLTLTEGGKKQLTDFFKIASEQVVATHIAPKESDIHVTDAMAQAVREKFALKKYIFCVSSGDPHKNLGVLIRSFALLKNQLSEDLVVCGYRDSEQGSILDAEVRARGLQGRVHFLGHVTLSELHALYKGAECFVYPTRFAGFGMPPLEAMSHGVPVIVSDVPNIPEVVGDAGAYFDPTNEQNIAEVILSVLQNPQLKERLQKAGPEHARQFTWENCAKKTLNVLLGKI